MAFAKWKAGKRGRRKILIVRWRDIAAPRGWREERRPKDLTLTQAREYARDMERRADLVAKGFATEPGRTTLGEIWDRWWEKDGSRRRGDSKHAFRQSLEKHLAGLKNLITLNLSDTKVTDAGIAGLVQNRELRNLQAENTGLTDTGLAKLKELPKLSLLFVRGSKVTAKGVEEFKKARPGCTVFN